MNLKLIINESIYRGKIKKGHKNLALFSGVITLTSP